MYRDDTAASSVLAIVLMMGFVAAATVSLFVVGSATLAEQTEQAQDRQVENTFIQLHKDVSSVAYSRQSVREMNFEIRQNSAAFRKENTGQITVTTNGTEIVNQSVGSLVYEHDDTTIAFQAGGLWRDTGSESRLMADPPFEYTNGSLTFPIPSLQGDETVHSGGLNLQKVDTHAPTGNQGYIEGQLVTVTIESEYYNGWAEYFRTETNDVAVSVNHSLPGEMGRVTVKLGRPLANGDFEDGVYATGGGIQATTGNANIDGPTAATGSIDIQHPASANSESPNEENDLYELDDGIERRVEAAKTNSSIANVSLNNGGHLHYGNTYYADDGFTLTSNDIDIHLAGGNVTLIVDGDISLDGGDIDVDTGGTNNVFRIYTTGDFGMKNSEAGPDWSESARHFQVYGTADMLVAIQGGGGTNFVGTIYAPRDSPALTGSEQNTASIIDNGKCDGWDTCVSTGSSNVKGAIVGGPTKFSQNAGLTYDSSLQDVEPTLQMPGGVLPPPITFLRVAVHEVAVNNSANVQPYAPANVAGTPGWGVDVASNEPAVRIGSDGTVASSPVANEFVPAEATYDAVRPFDDAV